MFGFFPGDGEGDWALVVATMEEIARNRVTEVRINLNFIGV